MNDEEHKAVSQSIDLSSSSESSWSEVITVRRWNPKEVRERSARHVAISLIVIYAVNLLLSLSLVFAVTFTAPGSARVDVARQMFAAAATYVGVCTATLAAIVAYYFKGK